MKKFTSANYAQELIPYRFEFNPNENRKQKQTRFDWKD
jgi:hypothetical protein